jgi:hypothetical protein
MAIARRSVATSTQMQITHASAKERRRFIDTLRQTVENSLSALLELFWTRYLTAADTSLAIRSRIYVRRKQTTDVRRTTDHRLKMTDEKDCKKDDGASEKIGSV